MAKIAMTSDKKIMVLNEGVEGIPSTTIDSELSDTSTNPVQNKVIKAAIDAVDTKVGNKQDKIGVNGLLKGDGTTISQAVAGTDYVVPSTALEEVPGHIANKSNPHGVTAEQVGARPNTWMPSASDVGAYTKTETNTLLQKKADLGADGKVPTSQLPNMEVDVYTKVQTLSDTTKTLLGLDATAVPDDAFTALAIGVGKYAFILSVQFADGSPVVGKKITGLSMPDGSELVTNSTGQAIGVASSDFVTISMSFSEYLDVDDFSTTITATSKVSEFVLTIPNSAETSQTVTSSGTYRFSPVVSSYDVAAISGGGGGAGGTLSRSGGGGGGGSVKNLFDLTYQGDMTVVVGAGGSGGTHISDTDTVQNGAAGGSTTITELDLTVLGGGGGYASGISSNAHGAGGSSTNGGAGGTGIRGYDTPGNGADRTVYPFNDSSISSGGGGGGGNPDSSNFNNVKPAATGGLSNGGRGAYSTYGSHINAVPGTFPGGGGGGGGVYEAGTGADGANGCVMFRWRYKEV